MWCLAGNGHCDTSSSVTGFSARSFMLAFIQWISDRWGDPSGGAKDTCKQKTKCSEQEQVGPKSALGTPKAGSPHSTPRLRAAIGLGKKTSWFPTTEAGAISPQHRGKTWPSASSRHEPRVSPAPWLTAVESPLCPTTRTRPLLLFAISHVHSSYRPDGSGGLLTWVPASGRPAEASHKTQSTLS